MSDIAIRVEGLSKQYRIGARQERYKALRDSITEAMAAPFRRAASLLRGQATGAAELNETIWALQDVSFEVKQSEVIGVIGRNGAGKSTLLKILSRITEPTKGYAEIYGRVGSLLEVGTGFHPELTGRENIFLNGAILGMRRREIERKFDEIVAFAEIEKFIDTPVKHYSSGMYVRLAFAVAAHLEPEILLVDEVLAVGDVNFQKKCLGKMGDVAKSGRTVFLVSHNMGAIASLCDLAIYFDSGCLRKIDAPNEIIAFYMQPSNSASHNGVEILPRFWDKSCTWKKGSILEIQISWQKYRFAPGWQCDLACYTLDGAKVFAIESHKLPGFSSQNPESNSICFSLRNIGFADKPLRFDVGFRMGPSFPYVEVVHNALMIVPDGRSLPNYKRNDVILVPDIACVVKVKET